MPSFLAGESFLSVAQGGGPRELNTFSEMKKIVIRGGQGARVSRVGYQRGKNSSEKTSETAEKSSHVLSFVYWSAYL